jgi:hypothetical protein
MKETKETHLTFHFESFRKMKPNLENKIKKLYSYFINEKKKPKNKKKRKLTSQRG